MHRDVEPRVAQPTFGRDLVLGLPVWYREDAIVLTQPEPWAICRECFRDGRVQVHEVLTMERSRVDEVTESFGPARAVWGIGGGSAVDHAKYVAWKRGIPLVLVPSILSVDAAFTKAIGVREGARVRYVGAVFPDHLLIDYGVLQASPAILNRAGVGDILSIFTALWDWREAGARLGEAYDPGIAVESRALLDRLLAGGKDIGDVTEAGLRLLAELYVGEVRLCEIVGNARPEEGSEHYVAYALEHRTRRHYLHGALVGLGVMLAGAWQGQDIRPVAAFLRDVGLDCRLEAVGCTREEVLETLVGMDAYLAHETQLLPGVFHFRGAPGPAEAEGLIRQVEEVLGAPEAGG